MAIGDALLARFKHAVALHVAALPAGSVAALAQVLDALTLLSPHAEAAPLLESLLAWRLGALREAATGANDAARSRRVSVVEAAFWEAVSRLAGEAAEERAPPPAHVSEALEALAFEALLCTPEGDAAERVARALGLLSRRRFAAVTARFLAELEARLRVDSNATRDQVAQLCRGLRFLHLPLSSEPDARASAAFLRAAAPLRWLPSKRKGEWHHCLCALLASVLGPALGFRPRPPSPAWADALAATRAEVLAWVARSERKHLAAGYPLACALLCCEEEPGAPQLRAFLEGPVARALRDKERAVRCAGVECLLAGLRFYAAAHGPRTTGAPGDPLWTALALLAQQLPAALRLRPPVWPGGRGEEALLECGLVAECCARAALLDPPLALEALLPDLLHPRPSEPQLGDAAATACQALLAAVGGLGGAAGLEAALGRVAAGAPALPDVPQLPAPLRSALGALARAAGPAAHAPAPPLTSDASPSAQQQQAASMAACALLHLVPYVVVDEWRAAGPGSHSTAAALLPYALAPDPELRAAAQQALLRCMRCGARSAAPRTQLLADCLDAAVRCAEEEHGEGCTAAVILALRLAQEWRARAEGQLAAIKEALEPARCEGACLALASQPEPATRRAALQLMAELALLRAALEGGELDATMGGAVEDAAPAALAAAARAAAAWPACRLSRGVGPEAPPSLEALCALRGAADGGRWARALGEVAQGCAMAGCGPALAWTRAHCLRRLAALTPALCGSAAEAAPGPLEGWRAGASLAAACSVEGAEGGREAARLLLAPLAAPAAPHAAQQAACAACECCGPALLQPLLEEAAQLREEAAGAARGGRAFRRAWELRTAVARAHAALAASGRLGPGVALADGAAAHVVAWAEDCARSLQAQQQQQAAQAAQAQAPASQQQQQAQAAAVAEAASPEELALQRHALALVAARARASLWPTQLRQRLFALAAGWALGEGWEAQRALTLARLPPRTPPAERAAADADATEAQEALRCAAADAAAQLAGAAGWEGGSQQVLRWAGSALERCAVGGERMALALAAQRALRACARACPDCLPALLESSYGGVPAIAHPHFSALAEGVRCHAQRGVRDLHVGADRAGLAGLAPAPPSLLPPTPLLLAAALFRLCDPEPHLRGDAAQLVAALQQAEWGGSGGGEEREEDQDGAPSWPQPQLPPPGSLPEAYLPPVRARSARLALSAPPELACLVVTEALGRCCTSEGLELAPASSALAALLPWVEVVRMDRHPGAGAGAAEKASAALLAALYDLAHLEAHGAAAEALWGALAASSAGAPALAIRFLLRRAGGEVADDDPSACCLTAKRCALFLARAEPGACVDALAAALRQGRGGAGEEEQEAGTLPSGGGGALGAPTAVLALLADLALEAPDELRRHLAQAVHAALLGCAAEEGEGGEEEGEGGVARARAHAHHARLLLAHILHGCGQAGEEAPAALLDDCWRSEQALAAAVHALLAACRLSPRLRAEWGAEALAWCCDGLAAREAVRSAEVLRALRCPLTQPAASALCECLAASLAPVRAARSPAAAARFAAACVGALEACCAATQPSKRLLYPCLFWAGAAALRAPPPLLAAQGARLLRTLLAGAGAGGAVVEEVLLLAAPRVAGLPGAGLPSAAPFPGLARLALRCAVGGGGEPQAGAQLLCRLAYLPAGGAADALFGDQLTRLPLAAGAALPWLLAGGAGEERAEARAALQAAARAQHGWARLAQALQGGGAGEVGATAAALAACLTPATAAVTAAALLAVLRGGPPEWHPPTLALLAAVLGAPAGARPVPDLSALTAAAVGPYSQAARQALDAALRASQRAAAQAPAQPLLPLATLWPEPDADAAAALLADALAGSGTKRRDAPAFLFRLHA